MDPRERRRITVDDLLDEARARIHRRTPEDAWACGAQIIDIRSSDQRRDDGIVPDALWFPRNVLEWRVDPACAHRDPAVAGLDEEVLLLCAQGYQSSLAAATMTEFGFTRVGDVVDGFAGWRAAGLPTAQLQVV